MPFKAELHTNGPARSTTKIQPVAVTAPVAAGIARKIPLAVNIMTRPAGTVARHRAMADRRTSPPLASVITNGPLTLIVTVRFVRS